MIDVENVSRQYGSFMAVDGISFSVSKGEIVGLLGPNGAGKTTTMRMITGFLGTSGGTIRIDGEQMTADGKDLKRKIGYMSESAPLYGEMLVEDSLKYAFDVHGLTDPSQVEKVARLCGLADVMHKNISELSRGYRQRVGLAHALMHDPEILILDEPTSGLDPNQIIEVRSLIRDIGKTRTVIISTHILSEVETLCDRVIIISRGKIVADSPTQDLKTRFGAKNILALQFFGVPAKELVSAIGSLKGVTAVDIAGEEGSLVSLSVSVQGEAEIRADLCALISKKGWTLYEMAMRKNSLEDVFRNLTAGGDE